MYKKISFRRQFKRFPGPSKTIYKRPRVTPTKVKRDLMEFISGVFTDILLSFFLWLLLLFVPKPHYRI